MTNYDESTHRPGRWTITLHATILGVAVAILIWLVADLPDEPRWYDGLGITAWTALVVLDLVALVKVLRKRWVPPTGYVDRDGDVWTALEDGSVALRGDPGMELSRSEVESVYGPLVPIYG